MTPTGRRRKYLCGMCRHVRELRTEGLAYDTIAERLNAEDIPGREGRWHATQA